MDSLDSLYMVQNETDNIDIYNACEEAINLILTKRKKDYAQKNTVEFPCRIGDTIYSILGEKVFPKVVDELRADKDDVYVMSEGLYFKKSQLGIYWFLDETVAENAFRIWRRRNKR